MKEILLRKIFVILVTGHYIALCLRDVVEERVVTLVDANGKFKYPGPQKFNQYDMFEKGVICLIFLKPN